MTDKEIDQAMAIIDTNNNGVVDYTEFIAACMQSYNYLNENHLKSAFSYFDKDSSGTISSDELKECLQYADFTMPESTILNLIKDADTNKDGLVSLTLTLTTVV